MYSCECGWYLSKQEKVCPNCGQLNADSHWLIHLWEKTRFLERFPLNIVAIFFIAFFINFVTNIFTLESIVFVILGLELLYIITWLVLLFIYGSMKRKYKEQAGMPLKTLSNKLNERLSELEKNCTEMEKLLDDDYLSRDAKEALRAAQLQNLNQIKKIKMKLCELEHLGWQNKIEYAISGDEEAEEKIALLKGFDARKEVLIKDLESFDTEEGRVLLDQINKIDSINLQVRNMLKHKHALKMVTQARDEGVSLLADTERNVSVLEARAELEEKDATNAQAFMLEKFRLDSLALLEKKTL